jgi:uncharacterized membrane-anchored protein
MRIENDRERQREREGESIYIYTVYIYISPGFALDVESFHDVVSVSEVYVIIIDATGNALELEQVACYWSSFALWWLFEVQVRRI